MGKAGGQEPRTRRAWLAPALATGGGLLVLLGLLLVRGAETFGEMSAGYAAKTLCSCVFVAGRQPDSCLREELGDYGFVETRLDREARTTEARSLVLGHARAEYLGPLGCTLE